jgi:perosamine synthetase
MDRIDQVIKRKRRNARLYNSLLKEVPAITLPPEAPWARPVYWLYTILIERKFKISRPRVIKELAQKGIDARPVFYAISSLPPYRNGGHERFPVADKISTQGLSLPSSPLLKAESIERVCDAIKKLAGNA